MPVTSSRISNHVAKSFPVFIKATDSAAGLKKTSKSYHHGRGNENNGT